MESGSQHLKIAFVTTCKNRNAHLALTLPKNMADNPRSMFVVLDYGSDRKVAGMREVQGLGTDRLHVYRHEAPVFHMANAKNLAHRIAIAKGADVIVTLDADNYAGAGFEDFIEEKIREPNAFLCPLVVGAGEDQIRLAPRGVAGRLAIRSQEFIKAGGYDEKYDTWRGEDVDIAARLRRMGFVARPVEARFLDCIRHSNGLRFAEYPHAAQYETDAEVKAINQAKHTLVNYGRFGCGEVWGADRSHMRIEPLPTRVFGIGLQRTATTSLAEAFKIFGFDSFHWDTGDKARDIWDEMNSFGRSSMLERYYALCDLPIPLLYKKLDAAYPGSKFVLTVRDEADWLRSVEWLFSYKNPERWTWDKWPFSNRIHQALYGRKDFDAATMLATYRRHNAEVVEYFRGRDDLLVMREPKWQELAKFLGKTVPRVRYPHKKLGG